MFLSELVCFVLDGYFSETGGIDLMMSLFLVIEWSEKEMNMSFMVRFF